MIEMCHVGIIMTREPKSAWPDDDIIGMNTAMVCVRNTELDVHKHTYPTLSILMYTNSSCCPFGCV